MKIFKSNKTKFVARWILVVLTCVVISSITLSSCAFLIGDVDWVIHAKSFNNHLEFANFIQDYNSRSDLDTSSFISFDFDENKSIDKHYEFRTRAPYKADNLYDDNTTDTSVELFFYFDKLTSNNEDDKLEYKIKCNYDKPGKIFFYTDNFEIKILGEDEVSGHYLINARDYQDERLIDNNEKNKKYDYAYSLVLLINGEHEMSIKISSTEEFSEQQINTITQMLLENILIISAGDEK